MRVWEKNVMHESDEPFDENECLDYFFKTIKRDVGQTTYTRDQVRVNSNDNVVKSNKSRDCNRMMHRNDSKIVVGAAGEEVPLP